MGSDDDLLDAHEIMAVFQSTLLAWGATVEVFTQGIQRIISIHAPRMGSDLASPLPFDLSQYFNPRSRMGSD